MTLSGRRYGALATPDQRYRVSRLEGRLQSPALVDADQQTTVTARFSPARRGRTVVLQRKVSGGWTEIDRARETTKGRTRLSVRLGTGETARLRAVARPHRGGPAGRTGAALTRAATWRSVHGMGGTHRCGITSTGDAVCAEGPAGRVRSVPGWSQVSGGYNYSCGVTTDEAAWCWGENEYGVFGNGKSNGSSSNPVQVAGAAGWASIEASHIHTCAVKTDHTAWCWGNNRLGQLGNGAVSNTGHPLPIQVGTDADWASVTTGYNFTCGLKLSGDLYCWGEGYGPIPVLRGSGYKSVSAGTTHACAVSLAGAMSCFGSNNYGEAGSSLDEHAWTAVSAGNYRTCGVRAEGSLWCWGHGNLGDGSTERSAIPKQVGPEHLWLEVSAGNRSGDCALRADHTAWCWGQARDGGAHVDLLPARRFIDSAT
ncbi:RCC1 domain-containing protein [Nocardioides coralli]|uniref:RCC1 domain-containing protein n=1 Tax=Nocardioides coralli TaxID=2872154 RepID=UPI001CA3EF02|nr:hypothetical protein [Nocardioides coralli]QZY29126.1 hypothetical protein K6T13_17135 [Nocardioides coralli]